MQHECKITVIDKKCFTDYQEQYLADPKSGHIWNSCSGWLKQTKTAS